MEHQPPRGGGRDHGRPARAARRRARRPAGAARPRSLRLLTFSGSHPHLSDGRDPDARARSSPPSSTACSPKGRLMLLRLVRTHLAPYQRRASPVVVALQFVGTLAMLYLPSLNAEIIDQGVVTGDTGYIVRARHGDARRVAGPGRCARSPPCGSPRGPRWASAATSAPRSSSRVGTFSAREVQHFGAPSLITRETNDVQQVQMLVLMGFTHDGVRADHDGRRHRDGDAARTSGCRG